jgi:hypothetical protein
VAVYYVKNGGNDGASGLSDALAWATFNNVTSGNINPGDSVFLKRGSLWRLWWGPDFAGTSSDRIILGAYGDGANPLLSGADLIAGWTLYSGNVWQAALTTDPGAELFIDGVFGDHKTSIGACVNEGDWYWTANVLYLYALADPDTAYTNPGVEARIRQQVIMFNQPYWTFDGITAEKSWGPCFRAYSGTGHAIIRNCIAQYGSDGIDLFYDTDTNVGSEFYGNICRYNNERGIGLSRKITGLKIYRNECHHNGVLLLGDAYTADIKFWDDGATMGGTDIYENYVHDCGRGLDTQGCANGVGIWPDTVHPSPSNPIKIHHNFLKDCTGEGIMVEISSDCHVYYNVIWSCGTCTLGEGQAWATSGILVSGRLNFETSDNLFYNNTIYGCNIGINVSMDNYNLTTGRLDNNIFKNNIVLGSITRPLSAGMGGDNDPAWNGSGNVYEYNCFGTQAANFICWGYGVFYSTYAAWEAAYGGSTHSVNADPLFTNATTGDFTLQATSPCIDVAVNLGTVYQMGLKPGSSWPGQ